MTELSRPGGSSDGAAVYERLDEETARASRYGLPLCCVVFRISAAEGLSGAEASRLTRGAILLSRHIVRQSDVVGGLGPGCFAVVANASGGGARVLAESVAGELRGLDFVLDGRCIAVEVCYGMSLLDEPKTARGMLEEARAALELRIPAHGIQGHS